VEGCEHGIDQARSGGWHQHVTGIKRHDEGTRLSGAVCELNLIVDSCSFEGGTNDREGPTRLVSVAVAKE